MGGEGVETGQAAAGQGLGFPALARSEGGRRLAGAFERARQEGRAALVGYWMGGYPDLATSERALVHLARSGCDVLEVGVPFSDPVADGPVLQTAAAAALQRRVSLRGVLEMAGRVASPPEKGGSGVPVVIMTYYNPVFRMGEAEVARAMARYGLSGMIVPDLPVEEAAGLMAELQEQGLAWVSLAAPTGMSRLERVASASDGFVYAISRPGVTGARDDLAPQAKELVDALRRSTRLPVALGFGVAGARQAAAYRWADGVVVGSAFASTWMRAGDDVAAALEGIGQLASSIRDALARPAAGGGG
ncbi:tryptophan synthase subunit alpha [Carboxydochorda subterranea]|uniref:Tryptophan synthase alpha chain n=1 Tax=Carboxydichorda subterranea TaxID=3109565 RepID=A0ABZ1C0A2_9FIRM|nr:tryptophan synthase subunit alpha [Limnochorda sp. L945t]WRP18519.1 tryptophan synthase subunit alpha [Limnochorda sp. L945t]